MTDQELKETIYHSPDEGFRLIFEKYHGYVYTIVFQILRGAGSSRDVDDCVVDVFSDVIMRYDPNREGSVQGFIGTLARNKAINLRRALLSKNWCSVSIDDMDQELPSDQDVQEQTELSETAGILIDRVRELGEPDSTIIIQKYFFDRNSREIGKIVGLSPAAVRVRCGRAVKRLRKILEDLDISF
jgi:RNA polymerase sigma-70 factor (ECF subfamily)